MYPLIIESIAAEQVRDRHERAARERLAKEARLRKARDGRARTPLSLPRALRLVRA
jgi:hypothetical protein